MDEDNPDGQRLQRIKGGNVAEEEEVSEGLRDYQVSLGQEFAESYRGASELESEVEQDVESKKLGGRQVGRERARMKRLQMISDAVQKGTVCSSMGRLALIITNSHFSPLLVNLRCIS